MGPPPTPTPRWRPPPRGRGRRGAPPGRGAWLAARNAALGNALIIGAGLLTLARPSVWPDVVVGAVMAVVNLRAAGEVLEQARAEDPEIEAA